jgi:hypothetical protein
MLFLQSHQSCRSAQLRRTRSLNPRPTFVVDYAQQPLNVANETTALYLELIRLSAIHDNTTNRLSAVKGALGVG